MLYNRKQLKHITNAVFPIIEKTIKKREFHLGDVTIELADAIEVLRKTYSEKKPPCFSKPISRLAYFVHYHPFHMIASIMAVNRFKESLQQPLSSDDVSAIDLGCGPGAASIGIDIYKKTYHNKSRRIQWDYIDKEHEWRQLISLQRHKKDQLISKTVWPFDLSQCTTNELHPLEKVISNKQLIVSMGLITELGLGECSNLTRLIQNCSKGTYVLLGDIKNKATDKSTLSFFNESLKDFKSLGSEDFQFTVESAWTRNKSLSEIYGRYDGILQKRNLSFDFLLLQKDK